MHIICIHLTNTAYVTKCINAHGQNVIKKRKKKNEEQMNDKQQLESMIWKRSVCLRDLCSSKIVGILLIKCIYEKVQSTKSTPFVCVFFTSSLLHSFELHRYVCSCVYVLWYCCTSIRFRYTKFAYSLHFL